MFFSRRWPNAIGHALRHKISSRDFEAVFLIRSFHGLNFQRALWWSFVIKPLVTLTPPSIATFMYSLSFRCSFPLFLFVYFFSGLVPRRLFKCRSRRQHPQPVHPPRWQAFVVATRRLPRQHDSGRMRSGLQYRDELHVQVIFVRQHTTRLFSIHGQLERSWRQTDRCPGCRLLREYVLCHSAKFIDQSATSHITRCDENVVLICDNNQVK
jgi:hypothetical protein